MEGIPEMASHSDPQLNALIQALYEGPLEETPWQDFLERLRVALGADQVVLMLRPPAPGDPGIMINASNAAIYLRNAYVNTYFALDPFVDLPPGQVTALDELVSTRELHASEFYRSILQPLGIAHVIGADLHRPSELNARLRASRNRGGAPFDADDKALMQQLLAHLEVAIRLHTRIAHTESELAVYADAVDHLAMGCIILAEDERVLRANRAAEQVLANQRHLRVVDGRLVVGNGNDNQQFRHQVREMLRAHLASLPSFIRTFQVPREDDSVPLGLLFRPLRRSPTTDCRDSPAVAVFISDPRLPRLGSADALQELFSLTRAEAQLAHLLTSGRSLDEAAEALNVTRNTAKSHLRSIFAKTGITRQSQLVQLVLGSVAGLAG